jgi:hypothetical protein
MKCLFATLMATTVLLAPYGRAVAFQDSTHTNVNSRYRIERISIQSAASAISRGLQREIDRLKGLPFRTELLDDLEKRIRSEFPGFKVIRSVRKGENKDQIHVLFLLERTHKVIDLNSPRLAFHSLQNFTFGAGADINLRKANFNFGLITDNNEHVERYSGIRGGFSTPINKRLRLAFIGESYRAQWDRQSDEFYRTRTNFEPTVLIDLAPGLELRAGLSFNTLEYQFPAARDQAAHAVISTLRYTKQWQLGLAGTQTLEAGYSLRAAANTLGSDFNYRRHMGEARFTLASGNNENSKSSLAISTLMGSIDGKAPVLDRFVLGNSNTLRGWNRADLAPFGGERMIHFSADGRYHFVRAVYDTGTIWNEGRPRVLRHSAGLGFVISGITAMVAIPLRSSSIEPIFLVGMNF